MPTPKATDPSDIWTDRLTRDLHNLAYKAKVTLDAENFSVYEEVEETPEGTARRGRVAILAQEAPCDPAADWKKNQWWTNLLVDVWFIHGQEPAIGFLAIGDPLLKTRKPEACAA